MEYIFRNQTYSCPLILSLDAISGKWKGVIIWFLLEESILRFGELKRKINAATKITDKMLIQCLRELESDGLIERKVYPEVPPKVEYSMTKSGERLAPVFKELITFGLGYESSVKRG